MNMLAEIMLEYMCFLDFSTEDQVDLRTSVKGMESIVSTLREASEAERQAVSQAASDLLASLLREPDEYGYSPRKTVTAAQREFLDSIASGKLWS